MIKDIVKFTTAAAILSPVLAAEDVLRYCGVPISKYGITKNDEGKGIFEIWKESEPEKPIDLGTAIDSTSLGREIDLSMLEASGEIAFGGDGPASSENTKWDLERKW